MRRLEVLHIYSKRSFWIISAAGILVAGSILSGVYLGLGWFLDHFSQQAPQGSLENTIQWLTGYAQLGDQYFFKVLLPAVTVSVLIVSWLIWLVLRFSMSSILRDFSPESDDTQARQEGKKDFIDHRIEQDRKRRLLLHSLSVLQRDGRLLDFFNEDLNLYSDDQIGAAVRSIQEDCKKTIEKYIDPVPVVDKAEGDSVVIEAGFDIDSIKLVGNVAGQPPFAGILRHRGWKARKKEIPKLSDIQDSSVISPAEIEIQS